MRHAGVLHSTTVIVTLTLIFRGGIDGPPTNADASSAESAATEAVLNTQNMIEVRPGESIQAAANDAGEGGAVLIKAGVHRFQTMAPKARQTFIGESGAILSGARVLTSFSRDGSAWVASGQTQQGTVSGSPGDGVCRSTAPRCGYPEDLFINNVPLQHVASVSAGGPGRWYFDHANNRIYLWDDPAGKTVETSVTPLAFGGTVTGVTIRNLVIEKYAAPTQSAAVQLGPAWIIEGSEVRWNHFAGISMTASTTAQGNHVHHNGAIGFFGAGRNLLVADNEIAYNGYAGYNPYWESGGSKWVFTENLTVRGNVSHHNRGPGLWTDINNIYTLYENNTVEDNERGGIFHEASYDATIRNNIVRRNGSARDYPYWTTGAGIEVLSSPNVEVYGNELEDNWQGITGLDDARGSGNAGPWVLLNLNVHDNTVISRIADPGGGRTGIVDMAGQTAFLANANNRFRQNHYVLGTGGKYFFWMGRELNESEWQQFGQDADGTFER
jgi:parallel beta-helix repeat protein